MTISNKAKELSSKIGGDDVKLGDIKKLAKTIKVDHQLAIELWSHDNFHLRLLAILIMDKKQLDSQLISQLVDDMSQLNEKQRDQLSEWLLANQLMKSKRTVYLVKTWESDPSPTLRRLFWYHQARLRWTGNSSETNSAELLELLEQKMANEDPQVQWAMNFCAGQIGIHEPEFRRRCIELGKDTGLYKDEIVAKNCTPAYLPEFIKIECAKRSN